MYTDLGVKGDQRWLPKGDDTWCFRRRGSKWGRQHSRQEGWLVKSTSVWWHWAATQQPATKLACAQPGAWRGWRPGSPLRRQLETKAEGQHRCSEELRDGTLGQTFLPRGRGGTQRTKKGQVTGGDTLERQPPGKSEQHIMEVEAPVSKESKSGCPVGLATVEWVGGTGDSQQRLIKVRLWEVSK